MVLNEEQLLENWQEFLGYIETYITGDRQKRLIDFYNKYEERFILLPASHKHNITIVFLEDISSMLIVWYQLVWR